MTIIFTFSPKANGYLLRLRVHPNATCAKLQVNDEMVLEMWVTEKPLNNQVNLAVLKKLGNIFKIPQNSLSLHAGQKSRDKTILIKNATPTELEDKLSAALV